MQIKELRDRELMLQNILDGVDEGVARIKNYLSEIRGQIRDAVQRTEAETGGERMREWDVPCCNCSRPRHVKDYMVEACPNCRHPSMRIALDWGTD